jgi:hypothetical protein
MTILDAIESAPTEHAIFFLVTAYIESLRHFERGCGVPQAAIELPVAGSSDLAARLEMLRSSADIVPQSNVARSETAAVLASALTRLSHLLQCADTSLAAGAMRSAKTDSRHSSLSV